MGISALMCECEQKRKGWDDVRDFSVYMENEVFQFEQQNKIHTPLNFITAYAI